jgi:DNA-binding NarL/FixJ family response regulator
MAQKTGRLKTENPVYEYMRQTKVFVADGTSWFLIGAMASLSRLPQVEIAGHAMSGAEALKMAEELSPDVLVLDADILGRVDWEALRRLRERPAPPRVVITAQEVSEKSRAHARALGADVCMSKRELGSKLFTLVGAIPAQPAEAVPPQSCAPRTPEGRASPVIWYSAA